MQTCYSMKYSMHFWPYPDQLLQNPDVISQNGGIWIQSFPNLTKSPNPDLSGPVTCPAAVQESRTCPVVVQKSRTCPVAIQEDESMLERVKVHTGDNRKNLGIFWFCWRNFNCMQNVVSQIVKCILWACPGQLMQNSIIIVRRKLWPEMCQVEKIRIP